MAIENKKVLADQMMHSDEMENVSGGSGQDAPAKINMYKAIYCYGDPNGQKHKWVKFSGVEGGHLQTYRCSNCGKVRIDQV